MIIHVKLGRWTIIPFLELFWPFSTNNIYSNKIGIYVHWSTAFLYKSRFSNYISVTKIWIHYYQVIKFWIPYISGLVYMRNLELSICFFIVKRNHILLLHKVSINQLQIKAPSATVLASIASRLWPNQNHIWFRFMFTMSHFSVLKPSSNNDEKNLREFEHLILEAHNTGSELGDVNHSRGLPPREVEAGYELITKNLVVYLGISHVDFLLY